MNKRMLLFALICSSISLAGCREESEPGKLSDFGEVDQPFLQAFSGNCLQNATDHDRIRAAADEFGWERMTDPEQLRMFAPEEADVDWSAWNFVNGERPFAVAISNGQIDGSLVSTCSVMAEVADITATKQRLVDMAEANLIDRMEEGGQLYEFYSFEHRGNEFVLSFLDGTPMEINILRASVMSNVTE